MPRRALHTTFLLATSHAPFRQPPSHGFAACRLSLLAASRWKAAVSDARQRHLHLAATSLAADQSTIYALSSAPGKAGIAVIRVSGPACLQVRRALCPTAAQLKPRYAAVRTLYRPQASDDVLDTDAVVLYFPGPKTVTGEDVLELHVHGGAATVRAVLSAIPATSQTAIRYAEPGEFTRRAFFHDRVDLAEVEALGAALDAETEQQRRAAVRGSGGRQLGATYDGWRRELLAARAEIEALIDFAEDQHFDESPTDLLGGVSGHVRTLLRALATHEAAADRGSLLRQGIRIALVGPANAGKSSMMNLVAGRAASIVSPEAGTTRDVVQASLDLRGYLCTFADTAGFRNIRDVRDTSAASTIEAEGIRRARQEAADADVVVVLAAVEPATHPDGTPSLAVRYDPETLRLAARAQKCLVVLNKCDLAPDPAALAALQADLSAAIQTSFDVPTASVPLVAISCRIAEVAAAAAGSNDGHINTAPPLSGASNADGDPGGIGGLVDQLARSFAAMTDLPPDAQHLLGVTARQQQLLAQCRRHLDHFLLEAGATAGSRDPDVVLAAEHLRYAADSLAQITGRGDVGDIEEVLGVIFEK
ncbi:mitochondrial GTPase [Grosmannia clavigera kw1407]|uniref:Mitochondrial GTPase n=1 Tax=Grosmannia clavigera (strain kw1407 / UAMH 11150) TaxID=655863 RepID=F0XKZ3_GROCL|nr:mitochondrial GTPase [Grosmannia clavigera kw1407]EFX01716.1 mitochondrial GTPase [Grosmannia clavigera kw1407]